MVIRRPIKPAIEIQSNGDRGGVKKSESIDLHDHLRQKKR